MRDELPPPRELTVDAFVARWQSSAASERSNYQLFLIELCELLGVGRPEPATGKSEQDQYVFERPVHFQNADGSISTGFIDLYRHASFVLETKQGCEAKQQETLLEQSGLRACEDDDGAMACAARAPGIRQCFVPAGKPNNMQRRCPNGRPF
jgi:hypothetical protein